MEGVDLGHRHIVIGAQPLGDFDHLRRHIQMKRRPLSAEIHPLGEGLEVVHRLDGLDLDDGGNFFPTVQSGQHDVRVDNRRTGPDRGILLGAWIDSGIETTAKPCLEKSNDPVVLQLLADRPDEDGAHENATITWNSGYLRSFGVLTNEKAGADKRPEEHLTLS